MLAKVVSIILAYLLTPVRGEHDFDMDLMHEEHMDTRVWEHAHNFTEHHMSQLLAEHRDHMELQQDELNKNEECPKCKCKACTMKGAKHVMTLVAEKIKKWCDSSDEEIKKEYEHGDMRKWFCMAFKKEPEIVLGYMAYKIRPIMISYTFCMGAKYCPHGDKAHEIVLDENNNLEDHQCIEPQLHPDWTSNMNSLNGHFLENHHHGHHHHHGDDMDNLFNKMIGFNKIKYHEDEDEEKNESEKGIIARKLEEVASWAGLRVDEKKMNEMDDVMVELSHAKNMQHICPKCFKRVMRFVMQMAIKRTYMMCKKTDNKWIMKMCKFAAMHKKFAFGGLLAHVQPEKYALGRCWHKNEYHHGGMFTHFFKFSNSDDEEEEKNSGNELPKIFEKISDIVNNIFHKVEKEGDATQVDVSEGAPTLLVHRVFRGSASAPNED